jgi:hypothetical protein
MDLLKLIIDKTGKFTGTQFQVGLESVIHHIEIAEKHHVRGKIENDDFLFTDVIYRTNHAFEGILKEAYSLLTGKESNKKSPYQIEKYFESNDILRPRVIFLFTNYRTQWRNPSTHDYQLFFTEQEAFLAIVNICAFISILLDQLIEKAAFDRKREEFERAGEKPVSKSDEYEALGLWEKVIRLLKNYSSKFPHPLDDSIQITEMEFLGGLSAFIDYSDKQITIYREAIIDAGNQNLRPDMILRQGNEQVILEFKKASKHLISSQTSEEQIFSYLVASGINKGILFFTPDNPMNDIQESLIEKEIGGKLFKILKIFPII